jgi:hypothetical protein
MRRLSSSPIPVRDIIARSDRVFGTSFHALAHDVRADPSFRDLLWWNVEISSWYSIAYSIQTTSRGFLAIHTDKLGHPHHTQVYGRYLTRFWLLEDSALNHITVCVSKRGMEYLLDFSTLKDVAAVHKAVKELRDFMLDPEATLRKREHHA